MFSIVEPLSIEHPGVIKDLLLMVNKLLSRFPPKVFPL